MNVTDTSSLPAGLTGTNTTGEKDSLGQEEFLKLMTTQLRNQDPLKPMESGDFLGQIAQFGTVSGIQSLESIISNIQGTMTADRSIRAAALLDRDVLVESKNGYLAEDGQLNGAIELGQAAGNVTVEVVNSSGERVDTIQLGDRGAGLHDFSWDGIGLDGTRQPAGTYGLQAIGSVGGTSESVPTYVSSRVQGVEMAANGQDLQLELAGNGSVSIDAVRRID